MARGLWLCGVAVLAAGAGMSAAQRYTPPPPPLMVDPCAARVAGTATPVTPADPKAKPVVCPPAAAVPAKGSPAGNSAAEQFPFPGEKSAANTPPSVADQFPFPGETSKSPDAVPEGNTPRYVPDAPSPGQPVGAGKVPAGEDGGSSSSSPGSSSSSSNGDTAPAGADTAPSDAALPQGRRKLAKVSALSQDERVAEDLDVAKFYADRGNFQAAYLRTKDATKLMPEDAESHFALARAAEKLQKKDEAAAEYALYLKLDPAGDKTTAAKKALAQLR